MGSPKHPLLPQSPHSRRQEIRARLRLPPQELSDDEESGDGTEAGRSESSCWHGSAFKAGLLIVVALSAALLGTNRASCGTSGGVTPADQYPQFLVVGDWGRGGKHNQTKVAAAMARKAEAMRTDFVLSTGDNFYPSGLLSPEDPAFDASFTSIYHQPSLQVPWHAALGNHDHGETADPSSPACGAWDPACFYSPLNELDARLAQRDARWHCERSFVLSLAGGAVDVFFLDTTPLLLEYAAVPWRANRGGLEEQSWEGQLRELEARLARSAAGWKLVVGHHPIRTTHRKWHAWAEMVEHVEPLLTKYGVQAYLCGHDHNLQLLHKPGTGYWHVTSGGGSRVGPKFRGTKHALFQHGGNGFVAVRLSPSLMAVEYMGLDSEQPLYSIHIARDGSRAVDDASHASGDGGQAGDEPGTGDGPSSQE
ncbi:hypothetical protein CHLNCDRAFT_32423 [Chlorella variabilis]|uniref:Calcineurin-like phosphoesterase domain-containing protein n=1 Tax=Chlorella variabilis TaxID=554065 RepID=E1ZN98_CHLVA|nr:hypothetical protein CHLNCDRAFT_32423 [Chlorella variabilis]EFN52564.1 hypothetical protein CHLNCDRAFT_32423 [Chlorella variabilis]|eukprot:XP_005844666.1 hypothetical protein CHLNCDRAFT_32423 [Chlorella variabilis]